MVQLTIFISLKELDKRSKTFNCEFIYLGLLYTKYPLFSNVKKQLML